MRLTAEQFAEMLALLQSRRPEKLADEKRRSTRVEVQARVPIVLITNGRPGEPYTVSVRDFSARGIAVLHPTPLEVGQQFVCSLRRHSGSSVSLLCTVMHSHPVADNLHRVGAEFTCTLEPQRPPPQPDIESRIRRSVLN